MGKWRHGACGLGALALVSACNAQVFNCQEDSQCDASDGGQCEPNGFCSFPDDGCESGRRYSDLAGAGLAGLCVVPSEGTSGPTTTAGDVSATGDPNLDTSTSDADGTATSGPMPTTSGVDPDSGTGDESGSSDGGPPASCGNGVQDPGEGCDDANRDPNDECNDWCQIPGELLWSDTIDADGGNDRGYALRVGPTGDYAIAGFATIGGPRAFVRRYHADDTEDFTFTAQDSSQGWGVDFMPDDTIAWGGWQQAGDGTNVPIVGALDPAGSAISQFTFGHVGRVWGLARIDDDVVVAGSVEGGGFAGGGLWAARLSPDAGELWTYDNEGQDGDWLWGIEVTSGGDVLVAGSVTGGGGNAQGTVRLLSGQTGTEIWSANEASPGTGRTGLWAAVEGPGAAYTVAGTYDTAASEWQLWWGEYSEATGFDLTSEGTPSNDEWFDVALDASGAVYLGGFTLGNGEDGELRKYRFDGTLHWSYQLSGAAGGDDRIFSVAPAPDGTLLVLGYVDAGGSDNDVWVARFAR